MSRLRTLREIFGGLKRRRPSRKYCPKCGDPNVRLSSKFDLWFLPERYVCEKCGYEGTLALELDEKDKSS